MTPVVLTKVGIVVLAAVALLLAKRGNAWCFVPTAGIFVLTYGFLP
jgi:hypothetical protein